jgi:hypothetical protein
MEAVCFLLWQRFLFYLVLFSVRAPYVSGFLSKAVSECLLFMSSDLFFLANWITCTSLGAGFARS